MAGWLDHPATALRHRLPTPRPEDPGHATGRGDAGGQAAQLSKNWKTLAPRARGPLGLLFNATGVELIKAPAPKP